MVCDIALSTDDRKFSYLFSCFGLFPGFLYIHYSMNIFMCFDGNSFRKRNFMSKKYPRSDSINIFACVSCIQIVNLFSKLLWVFVFKVLLAL